MKRRFIVLLMLLAAPAFAQRSVPEIPFESVPNYFKYPPEMNLGEMASVAVNSKGHVFTHISVINFTYEPSAVFQHQYL